MDPEHTEDREPFSIFQEDGECVSYQHGLGLPTGSSKDWVFPFASLRHLEHKVRSVSLNTANICGAELKTICLRHREIWGINFLQVGKPQIHKWVTHNRALRASSSSPCQLSRTGLERKKGREDG